MRWLGAGLLLIVATFARADDDSAEKAQARMLLSQGNTLFEKGDLRGALVDFRAAYRLFPSPKLLVNVAAAERELGDLAGAATDLRHFIDDVPTDDDPFLVDRARSDLRALERKLGRIGIAAWPKGSTLEIDGRPARDPTYVRPGAHSVQARLPGPGSVRVQSEVELAAGQVLELGLPAGAQLVAKGTAAPRPPASNRRGTLIGILVTAGALVVGGAVAGIVVATTQSPQPLKGDLGTIPFTSFH